MRPGNTAAAVGAYQEWLDSTAAATWCRDFIELAEALAAALVEHNEQELLDRWVNQSVNALKLPSLG